MKTARLTLLIVLFGVFSSGTKAIASEHKLLCWVGCFMHGQIQDEGDRISFRLFNDSSQITALAPKATKGLVDAGITQDSDLAVEGLSFSVPKTDCTQHSTFIGVLSCKTPAVMMDIVGRKKDHTAFEIHPTVAHLDFSATRVATTLPQEEYLSYSIRLGLENGAKFGVIDLPEALYHCTEE